MSGLQKLLLVVLLLRQGIGAMLPLARVLHERVELVHGALRSWYARVVATLERHELVDGELDGHLSATSLLVERLAGGATVAADRKEAPRHSVADHHPRSVVGARLQPPLPLGEPRREAQRELQAPRRLGALPILLVVIAPEGVVFSSFVDLHEVPPPVEVVREEVNLARPHHLRAHPPRAPLRHAHLRTVLLLGADELGGVLVADQLYDEHQRLRVVLDELGGVAVAYSRHVSAASAARAVVSCRHRHREPPQPPRGTRQPLHVLVALPRRRPLVAGGVLSLPDAHLALEEAAKGEADRVGLLRARTPRLRHHLF